MKRTVWSGWMVIVCVTVLSACKDNGLPDRNLPIEEAVYREFGYPVYQASPANTVVAAAGRHWIRSQTVEVIPGRLLVQIADADGTALYARRDEQAPFAVLFSPVGQDRWAPYRRLN